MLLMLLLCELEKDCVVPLVGKKRKEGLGEFGCAGGPQVRIQFSFCSFAMLAACLTYTAALERP